MLHILFSLVAVVTVGIRGSNAENRSAVANVHSENVTGRIEFTEVEDGLHVRGTLLGLKEGKYGFHIHELGDTLDCMATGAHFNPDDTNHGGRNHTVRHVGDLGNVVFANETAILDYIDTEISLRGRNNILGRAVVIHENEDDLGLGGNEGSLSTGNAGSRIACATIGILRPADPWNSATVTIPSLTVLLCVFIFSSIRNIY
ncbi:uncharacterized protein ACR2FA_000552 [Aphomia sociella]